MGARPVTHVVRLLLLVALMGLPACTAQNPTPSPRGVPDTRALVALVPHGMRQIPVRLTLPVRVDTAARIGGLRPIGGSNGGTAYVLTQAPSGLQVSAIDAAGAVTSVRVVRRPTGALAVFGGHRDLMAYGASSGRRDLLVVSSTSGKQQTVAATLVGPAAERSDLYAARWSRAGSALYFGRNPSGLGGYAAYLGDGLSSLSRYDLARKSVQTLVPYADGPGAPIACIDDLSGDQRRVVDTCVAGEVRVLDLSTGEITAVYPPSAAAAFGLLRDARFSPDGSRVAFALNRGNPEAERGAIAVSRRLGGRAQFVVLGPRGSLVMLLGWLNGRTLLVQTQAVNCSKACSTIWVARLGTDHLQRLADATAATLS
jgi:hypothetical protein